MSSPTQTPLPPSRGSREVPAARGLLSALFAEASPLDLRILGRTLLHAALVGAAAGAVGAAFFAALEYFERLVLIRGVGYRPLRAFGEAIGTIRRLPRSCPGCWSSCPPRAPS